MWKFKRAEFCEPARRGTPVSNSNNNNNNNKSRHWCNYFSQRLLFFSVGNEVLLSCFATVPLFFVYPSLFCWLHRLICICKTVEKLMPNFASSSRLFLLCILPQCCVLRFAIRIHRCSLSLSLSLCLNLQSYWLDVNQRPDRNAQELLITLHFCFDQTELTRTEQPAEMSPWPSTFPWLNLWSISQSYQMERSAK